MGLAQTFGQGFGWFFTSTYLIMMGSLLVTAKLTIIAFYKRNSNAVALATFYMIFMLSCLHLLCLPSTMSDDNLLPLFLKLCFRFGSVAEELDAAAIVARELASGYRLSPIIHSFLGGLGTGV